MCSSPEGGCRGRPRLTLAPYREHTGLLQALVPPAGYYSPYLRHSLLSCLTQTPLPLPLLAQHPRPLSTLLYLSTHHPLQSWHVHACYSHYMGSSSRVVQADSRGISTVPAICTYLHSCTIFWASNELEELPSSYIIAFPCDLSPVQGHCDLPKGKSSLSLLGLFYCHLLQGRPGSLTAIEHPAVTEERSAWPKPSAQVPAQSTGNSGQGNVGFALIFLAPDSA